ncbi:MAG: hypothetical protein AAF995_03795 [Planctomycetota bacterium]
MTAQGSFLDRNYHLVRRLHSLTGIVPIGLFLIVHLTTNSSIVWGAFNGRASHATDGVGRGVETFQHEVYFINNLPLLLLTEIFVLWLPIAFHSIFGFYFAFSGKRNTDRYAYQNNWRYTLQRWTGYVGFLFIFYHIATLRWGWTALVPDGTKWEHEFASSTLAAAIKGAGAEWTLAGVLVAGLYFLGVTSLVFHFANGLWTAAITWGVTVSAKAQKQWGYACAGIGVGLMGAGYAALGGFLVLDYDKARQVEQQMFIEKFGEDELRDHLEGKADVDPEVAQAVNGLLEHDSPADETEDAVPAASEPGDAG